MAAKHYIGRPGRSYPFVAPTSVAIRKNISTGGMADDPLSVQRIEPGGDRLPVVALVSTVAQKNRSR
jgi:hypothetical protein